MNSIHKCWRHNLILLSPNNKFLICTNAVDCIPIFNIFTDDFILVLNQIGIRLFHGCFNDFNITFANM